MQPSRMSIPLDLGGYFSDPNLNCLPASHRPCTARPELALTMSVGIVVVQTNTTLVLSSLGDCAEKLDS
jgi:hypothetical protein